MPPVKTADPAATPDVLDNAFAAAMGAEIRPREAPAPPEVDPEAPHGRDADGTPLAPYGWTTPQRKDEKPRPKRTASGRKAKEDEARTAPPVSPPDNKQPAGGSSGLAQKDYSESLAATSEALWVGLSMASMMPLDRIPVISALPVPKTKDGEPRKLGQLLAGATDKIAAQAHIFNANRGALVQALNMAANNNQRARNLAEKLETGDATWALMCGAMVMPFLSQSASLWTGTLAEDELPPVEQLAEANRASLDGWVAKFNAGLQAATAEATAELAAMNGHNPEARAA